MEILFALLTIIGLSMLEIVSSVDNAVINADVLTNMSKRARRWFLTWGILFAVFIVRGLLPFIIVYLLNPGLGFTGIISATFSGDPMIVRAIEASAPPLLVGGGTFLIFLFFNWLFMQSKHYGLRGERYIHTKGIWFYAVVSILLCIIVWFSIHINPLMAFGAVVGSTAFFITHGFKQNAEQKEREMLDNIHMSDWSKIMYLEVIDTTFSIDGVLGAFAFTLFVPLILIGNGIGAIVVRQITMSNIENVKKYKYLKNGAMYSVGILGVIMILESFGAHLPSWLSPIITIIIIGYFFWKSKRELDQQTNVVKNKNSISVKQYKE
ncbi:MAG: DUF475 domain-containing protein [Candidatus Aenigmarchaeota archaeon]|nr:DUF475 domain-containing protein [Candidatus Aenigmarchaeota archaeon]